MPEQLINDRVRIKSEGDLIHVILARPEKHNAVDMAILTSVIKAAKKIAKDKQNSGKPETPFASRRVK